MKSREDDLEDYYDENEIGGVGGEVCNDRWYILVEKDEVGNIIINLWYVDENVDSELICGIVSYLFEVFICLNLYVIVFGNRIFVFYLLNM